MRRLCLLAGSIGILFSTAGCGAAILANADARAIDATAESTFPSGSSREEVEAKLGKPDASKPFPDGSRADTYTYTLRSPEWGKLKWMHALGTVITVGFFEPLSVSLAAYEVSKQRRTATFRYGSDDALIESGLPPAFGPADDTLPPLTFDTIKERCRSEDADAPTTPAGGASPPNRSYGYQACVVRRLAIWGVE